MPNCSKKSVCKLWMIDSLFCRSKGSFSAMEKKIHPRNSSGITERWHNYNIHHWLIGFALDFLDKCISGENQSSSEIKWYPTSLDCCSPPICAPIVIWNMAEKWLNMSNVCSRKQVWFIYLLGKLHNDWFDCATWLFCPVVHFHPQMALPSSAPSLFQRTKTSDIFFQKGRDRDKETAKTVS